MDWWWTNLNLPLEVLDIWRNIDLPIYKCWEVSELLPNLQKYFIPIYPLSVDIHCPNLQIYILENFCVFTQFKGTNLW
jgi:hypothetical protein